MIIDLWQLSAQVNLDSAYHKRTCRPTCTIQIEIMKLNDWKITQELLSNVHFGKVMAIGLPFRGQLFLMRSFLYFIISLGWCLITKFCLLYTS